MNNNANLFESFFQFYSIYYQGVFMLLSILARLLALGQNLLFITIGGFAVGFLIAFHEFGHYLFARFFNIHAPAFSIGFGPQLLSKKIGETVFSLSAIPFGGYVQLESNSNNEKPSTRSFESKPYYQKLLVMCGGIGFNFLFAYFVFILLAFIGMPKTLLLYPKNATAIIEAIAPESPAHQSNLAPGDRIIAINNTPINNDVEQLHELLKQQANQTIKLSIERNGIPQEINTTLGERRIGNQSIGTLGVMFALKETPGVSFLHSIKQGITLTNTLIKKIFMGLISLFTQRNFEQVAGPLMIVKMTSQVASQGISILLIFLAMISINLGVLNLLPIPIFDGGQILLYTIEAIIRRPLPEKARDYIKIASWLTVMSLLIFLSIKDITNLASPHIKYILQFFGFGK